MTTKSFNSKFKDGRMFTGCFDKNGKEIYDCDRVEVSSAWHKFSGEKGTVQYVPESAAFGIFYDTPDLNGSSLGADGKNNNWDEFGEFDEIVLISE